MTSEAMNAAEFNDAALVADSLKGNREAFRRIVERYQTLIASLAYCATGNVSQSEDLAQETFVSAWKHLADLREPAKLRPWLCSITRFLISKQFRRQGREPAYAAESLEAVAEWPAREPLPPEQAISTEEKAILWRSLERLPELYREPLVLFYREHQSIAAVARDLELTEDTVKQRLARGRSMLQEQVLAFVEGALERTKPDKAFTLGVIATLSLLTTSARAATAGTTATQGGLAVKLLFMTETTKAIIVAALALAALTTPVAVHYYQTSGWGGRNTFHLKGRLRAWPGSNFLSIAPEADFVPVEIWKELGHPLKWRVEKPGRVAVMDGQTAILYFKGNNLGIKIPHPSRSAFDTDWLQEVADLSHGITNEMRNARSKGWKVETAREFGANGRELNVVTIETLCGLPDDNYLKNKGIDTSDTRRVYRFDARTRRLVSAQFYLLGGAEDELIFETSQVDYNQSIKPAVFHLDLPANITWYQKPQKLPDNQKYAAMTPKEAARSFFEACAKEDWDEAGKFMANLTPDTKKYLGGLEIISVGEPYQAKPYGGQFIPYEVKLPPTTINVRVSNANPAKRCVLTGVYDEQLRLEQDLKWVTTPEILPNNEVYARMTPAETVKAYFEAQARLDWGEMGKFTTGSDVADTQRQVEQMQKTGLDAGKYMPTITVDETVWSAKESAWFVKCQMTQIKKWNLALRNDNAAGRWQVDGGL